MGSMIGEDRSIFSKKGEPLSVRVDFSEMVIRKDGEKVHCFLYADSLNAYALEKNGKKATFPGLAILTLDPAKGDCSKFLAQEFKGLDEGKVYSGFMAVDDGNAAATEAIKGVDAFVEFARKTFYSLMEIPAMVNLKADDIKIPASRGGGGGARAMPPSEKFADAMKVAGIEAKSVLELALVLPEAIPNADSRNAFIAILAGMLS